MDHYMDAVLRLTGNSCPRVRRSAFVAIVQLWGSLSISPGSRYYDSLMPVISLAISDFEVPDFQAHGALALVFLSERCTEAECMARYLDSIIFSFLKIIDDVDQQEILLSAALKGLGSFASASKEFFGDYYDSVMPHLQTVLASSFDKRRGLVASSAIKSICCVASVVPRSKFSAHSNQVIEQLLAIQLSVFELDSLVRSALMLGWVDLYKCLGSEFVFHMKNLMPFFIDTAAKTFEDNTDVDQSDFEDQILSSKAAACKMISLSAAEMKENFYPWISQAVGVIVPLLKFKPSEQVREAAISAIPELLRSAKLSKRKGLVEESDLFPIDEFVYEAISILVETLHEVPASDGTCAVVIKVLTDCIRVIGLVSVSEVESMIDVFIHILRSMGDESSDVVREISQEDLSIDEHEKGKMEEEIRVDIVIQIGSCLGSLAAVLEADFLPYFDELFPFLVALLGSQRSVKERTAGYQIFNQVILHSKQASVVYFTTLIPFLVKAWTDNDTDILEVSAQGIAACAEFGGKEFKPYANLILSQLKSVLELPDDSSLCNSDALAATASAIEKIFKFHHDCVNIHQGCLGVNLH